MLQGKSLIGDGRKCVSNARQSLDLVIDEMADIGVVGKKTFHDQIVLTRCRMDLRNFFDPQCCRVGDIIGFAEFAFDLNEDCQHG